MKSQLKEIWARGISFVLSLKLYN